MFHPSIRGELKTITLSEKKNFLLVPFHVSDVKFPRIVRVEFLPYFHVVFYILLPLSFLSIASLLPLPRPSPHRQPTNHTHTTTTTPHTRRRPPRPQTSNSNTATCLRRSKWAPAVGRTPPSSWARRRRAPSAPAAPAPRLRRRLRPRRTSGG